jgi:hypothetical protein
MARKREEVAQLLANKFKKEAARLKSWETKTDDKAALSFAMVVVDFVRALMCESRMREMKRFNKFIVKNGIEAGDRELKKYVLERISATRKMSKVIEEYATKAEEKRPWKRKKEHRHHSSKHNHKEKKHGHSH